MRGEKCLTAVRTQFENSVVLCFTDNLLRAWKAHSLDPRKIGPNLRKNLSSVFSGILLNSYEILSNQTVLAIVLEPLELGTLRGKVVNAEGIVVPGYEMKLQSPLKTSGPCGKFSNTQRACAAANQGVFCRQWHALVKKHNAES